jgi:hypothetical protein
MQLHTDVTSSLAKTEEKFITGGHDWKKQTSEPQPPINSFSILLLTTARRSRSRIPELKRESRSTLRKQYCARPQKLVVAMVIESAVAQSAPHRMMVIIVPGAKRLCIVNVRAMFAERADTNHAVLNEKPNEKGESMKQQFRRWKRYNRKQKRFYARSTKGPFRTPRRGSRIFLGIPNNDPLKKALCSPVHTLASGRPFRIKPGGRPDLPVISRPVGEYMPYWQSAYLPTGGRMPEYLPMNSVAPGSHFLKDSY